MNDKKFFLLAIALENATQRQLDILTNSVNKTVKKYTRGGIISDQQAMVRELNRLIDDFYDLFVEHLAKSSEKVGKAKAQQAIDETIPALRSAGLYLDAIAFYKEVRAYEQSVIKRFMMNNTLGDPLPFRIKTIKAGSQKTIQNIVNNAFRDGTSAKNLALKLEQYINPLPGKPRVEPYKEYRKRFGRPKNFTPKGVPAGSVQFNAMRIARTELSRMYRQATIDFYKDKKWVKGFKWVLSNSHPKPDICDDYAAVELYTADDVPNDKAHPHCMCDVIHVQMTVTEMKALNKGQQNVRELEYA